MLVWHPCDSPIYIVWTKEAQRSWLHGEITIKYENTIFIALSLKNFLWKKLLWQWWLFSASLFFCTLLKFMQGDNVQARSRTQNQEGAGKGASPWHDITWFMSCWELLLIGCSLVGCLVSVSWLSHCSELYKFAYFLPRLLPVRRSTAVRIIWKWPLHWRFLYFL